MRRREFMVLPAKSMGGLPLYTLSAACERILPGDDSGPGATEAGVVIYSRA